MPPMTDPGSIIAENVRVVRQRIADAARRSGRTPDSVLLTAVTKYVDAPMIESLIRAGCRDFGESRPQQLWRRAEELGDRNIGWHLIGHLQRNKAKRTVPLLAMAQSVDSLRIAEAIDSAAMELSQPLPILLEANISGDSSKTGMASEELKATLPKIAELKHVEVRGLMGMASLEGGLDEAKRNFAALRELRDELRKECPDGTRLNELSMGMSDDFETAIEEGATIVRIGSLLFENIP